MLPRPLERTGLKIDIFRFFRAGKELSENRVRKAITINEPFRLFLNAPVTNEF
jgi:hypothetical protein